MAWVAPVSRATGYVITASNWNDVGYSNLRYLKGLDGAITIEDAMELSGNLTVSKSNSLMVLENTDKASGQQTATIAKYTNRNAIINETADTGSLLELERPSATSKFGVDKDGACTAVGNSTISKADPALVLENTSKTAGQRLATIVKYTNRNAIINETADTGSLLALERPAATSKFGVDKDGVLTVGVIPSTRLKTSTGSATGSLIASVGTIDVTMNDYTFAPSVVADTATSPAQVFTSPKHGTSNPSDTIGCLRLNNENGSARDYWVNWRYVTASGNPEIWIGLDSDGKIASVWEAEDPPPTSPPIDSHGITKLIKLNPDTANLMAMRKAADNKLGEAILKSDITNGKLSFRGFELTVEIRNKEDVPRLKRVKRTITKTIKEQVLVMIEQNFFSESEGRWETRKTPKTESNPMPRFRLTEPKLGEGSPIEQYEVLEEQPVFEEKEIEIEEVIEYEVAVDTC